MQKMKEPVPFTCPFCGAELNDLENIEMNTQTPGFRCKICESKFPINHPHCLDIIRVSKKQEQAQSNYRKKITKRIFT